jgi:hypothetical protein
MAKFRSYVFWCQSCGAKESQILDLEDFGGEAPGGIDCGSCSDGLAFRIPAAPRVLRKSWPDHIHKLSTAIAHAELKQSAQRAVLDNKHDDMKELRKEAVERGIAPSAIGLFAGDGE